METEQAVPGGNTVSGTCYELRERKAAATSLGDGSGILYLPGGGTRSYNGRHLVTSKIKPPAFKNCHPLF